MALRRHRLLFVLCAAPTLALLASSGVPLLRGDQQKTGDLIIVSGARSLQQWREKDRVAIGGHKWYLALETMTCAPRGTAEPPLDVLFWVQGLPGISFIDLRPSTNHPGAAGDVRLQATTRPQELAELLLPPSARGSSVMEESEAWGKLISYWESRKLLQAVLRTHLESASASCLVGYLVRVPADNFQKAQAQIMVAAGNAEPQTFPISLELRAEGSAFSSLGHFLDALLSQITGGVAGVALGTIFGYLVFRAQQSFLIRSEEQKKFRDKKIELSKSLWSFFKKKYDNFRTAANLADIERVKLIREALIEDGIYAILPPGEISCLNQICKPDGSPGKVGALDRLLRDNFLEFML